MPANCLKLKLCVRVHKYFANEIISTYEYKTKLSQLTDIQEVSI